MFLTFLYAAALDVVLGHTLLRCQPSFASIMAMMVFVLLLASDWSSKARSRRLLPCTHGLHYPQFVVELLALLCLLFAGAYLLEEGLPNRAPFLAVLPTISDTAVHSGSMGLFAFALFGLLSAVWNLMFFRTLSSTLLRDIIRGLRSGTVDTIPAAMFYIQPYLTLRRSLQACLARKKQRYAEMFARRRQQYLARSAARPPGDDWRDALYYGLAGGAMKLFQHLVNGAMNILQSLADGVHALWSHFVALHLILLNGAAGILLLLHALHPASRSSGLVVLSNYPLSPAISIAVAMLAVLSFAVTMRRTAVALLALAVVSWYFIASPVSLLITVMLQQLVVTTFLHFAVAWQPTPTATGGVIK